MRSLLVGTAGISNCEPEGVDTLAPGARTALDYLGGFLEGLAVLAAAGGPDSHPHAGRSGEAWVVWERDVSSFDRDLRKLNRFFLDLIEERLTEEAEIRTRGFEFVNTEDVPQGAFYTVGWKMAAIVEKARGRAVVIESVCDPRILIAAYQQIALEHSRSNEAGLARWSPELLAALGAPTGSSPGLDDGISFDDYEFGVLARE